MGCFMILACQPAVHSGSTLQAVTPKNVILMIGDGMGVSQVSIAIDYRRVMQPQGQPLVMEEMFNQDHFGKVRTHAVGSVLTDSAAAATALACGVKTLPGILGKDASGRPCESILEFAKKRGKLTGVVSTMRVTHATPAAFYSHVVSRDDENAIANQLVLGDDVDVVLGGGFRHFSTGRFSERTECGRDSKLLDGSSKRTDGEDLLAEGRSGYNLVCNKEQLDGFDYVPGKKVLGTFAASHFPYWQERHTLKELPSLSHLTHKSLEWLSKGDKGFFLMVEGGLIDYAGHANDAASLLREVLDFDQAIRVAREYVRHHPDTLLIVTADHATGGIAYTPRAAQNEAEMPNRKLKSGDIYTNNEIFPDGKFVFDKLLAQKISFGELLYPLVMRLYPEERFDRPAPGVDLDTVASELKTQLEIKSAFTISQDEAKRILSPESTQWPQWNMFHYPEHVFLHVSARLGLTLMPQNFVGWVSSDHTPEPVDLLCAGPQDLASRCKGLVDNTDVYRIMKTVFDGH